MCLSMGTGWPVKTTGSYEDGPSPEGLDQIQDIWVTSRLGKGGIWVLLSRDVQTEVAGVVQRGTGGLSEHTS